MRLRPFFLALIATALAAVSSPPPAAIAAGLDDLTPGTASAEIYGFNHLETLGTHATIVYDYRLEGRMMEAPFTDEIVLDFAHAQTDAKHAYDVEATLFAKGAAKQVGPIVASTFNPLLLIFFQRDVNQMSRGTGGSGHYFRNVIRHAMSVPGNYAEEAVSLEIGGKPVAAHRVSFTPFADDSHKDQMRGLAAKTYTITVSDAVPGGLVALETETAAAPGAPGEGPMLHESYRFREVRP